MKLLHERLRDELLFVPDAQRGTVLRGVFSFGKPVNYDHTLAVFAMGVSLDVDCLKQYLFTCSYIQPKSWPTRDR